MKTCFLLSPDTLTIFSNSDNYFLTLIFLLSKFCGQKLAIYPASRGFFLPCLLVFTKSLTWLDSRVDDKY